MNTIITIITLLTVVLGLAYVTWLKGKICRIIYDVENRIMSEIHKKPIKSVFITPNKDVLTRYTKKSCVNIAKQLETNTFSDDDYGDFSRECAIVILKALAENMPENINLKEYFAGKKSGSI